MHTAIMSNVYILPRMSGEDLLIILLAYACLAL